MMVPGPHGASPRRDFPYYIENFDWPKVKEEQSFCEENLAV